MTNTTGSSRASVVGIAVAAALVAAVLTLAATLAITSILSDENGGEAGGAGGGAVAGAQSPPPGQVRVDLVQQQTLRQRAEIVGRLQEVRHTTVAAEVEGKVLAMNVDAGDEVVGGETVLARIDEVWARLELQSAQAEVAAAEATLDQSRRDFEQLQQLQASGSAQPKEVQDQQAQVKSNQATLEAARARLAQAQERVQRLEVIAPFDGLVTQKLTETGQWVTPGTGVAELISRGEIDAVLNVPERHISVVQNGDPVEVRIDPLNRTVTGEVVSINPSASNEARTFPVEVRLPDEDGLLKPGMSATGRLPLSQERQYLTVSRNAVQFMPTGARVWVAAPQDEGMPLAQPAGVEVLFGQGDRFAVEPNQRAGPVLQPEAQVVIEGAEMLFPTRPLMIVEGDGGGSGDEASGAPQAAPNNEGGSQTETASANTQASGTSR